MSSSISFKSIAIVATEEDRNDVLLVRRGSRNVNYKSSKKFISDIPKIFKNVKGVILNVFDYQSTGFETNMDFCKAVKEKMDLLEIDYRFELTMRSTTASLLASANITVKFQEMILMVFTLGNDNEADVFEYEYTQSGYKEISQRDFPIDIKENPKLIREKILGTSNPAKIILASCDNSGINPLMKCLRDALKSNKLIVFDKSIDMEDIYIKQVAKWFMDKSYTKYYILPTCARYYIMVAFQGKLCTPLLPADMPEPLPFEESYYLNASTESILYGDKDDKTSYQTLSLEGKCHQYKVTVNIDVNNFLDISYEALTFQEIEDLPKHLDEKFDKNIPVIGIMGELSVICIHKNGGYEFLDAWNGFFVKQLIVNFEEEKPKYFEHAYLPGKQGCLVYDLIEIISLPIDQIKNNEKWKFTVTKDADHPILLEFDNYDGTKKAASPAFLMALLLKQHLKAIKKETGTKPTEIGICLLQKFSENERKRVEEQLEGSCKLLKIDCVFVNV